MLSRGLLFRSFARGNPKGKTFDSTSKKVKKNEGKELGFSLQKGSNNKTFKKRSYDGITFD